MHSICALATGQGGAIAVIRVSGDDAINITDRIFSKSIQNAPTQTLHYGHIVTPQGETVDEVLVSVFRAPHSYTGENATEISCHASPYIISRIQQLLIDGGCQMAEPGEYTKRAFLNGRMDLSQAEAVADLIAARSAATHRIALSQMRGGFSQKLRNLRERLLKLTSLMELELDFSEHEDLEFADRSELLQLIHEIQNEIRPLIESFQYGNAIKNGLPVAIVGCPNAGKSTLLNALLQEEKAIVSNVRGTTRDAIEDCITLRGVTFRFIDTAGLRETTDEVEQIGIERSYAKLNESSIVLWLVPAEETIEDYAALLPGMLEHSTGKHLIIILSKSDLTDDIASRTAHLRSLIPAHTQVTPLFLALSGKTENGITELQNQLLSIAHAQNTDDADIIITNQRHYAALKEALTNINQVEYGMSMDLPTDLLSEDLRACLRAIGSIIGEVSSQEVLNNIFSHFCIGK